LPKFLTITTNWNSKKNPIKVESLLAGDVHEAYDLAEAGVDQGKICDLMVVKAECVNKLILDLNKVARKL